MKFTLLALLLAVHTGCDDSSETADVDQGLSLDSHLPDTGGPDAELDAEVDADPDAALGERWCGEWGEILNIAHRGGKRVAPEHTFAAYDSALQLGADVLEIDTHITVDGAVVVLHDDTVDRTTDGVGEIADMTLEQVRTLDAGYHYDSGNDFPFRGLGHQVPLLTELLDRYPESCFTVELKSGDERLPGALVDMFRERGLLERTVFAAFSPTRIQAIRDLESAALTGLALDEMPTLITQDRALVDSWEPKGRYAQIPKSLTDVDSVARALRFGVELHPWTVNSREEMAAVIALGVGGIITDDPGLLAELLAAESH